MKVYNTETWLAEQKGKKLIARTFNKASKSEVPNGISRDGQNRILNGQKWMNSAERYNWRVVHERTRKMLNSATGPDPSEMERYAAETLYDIQRTALDMPNYLATMYNIINRPGVKAMEIKLRDLLPPVVMGKKFNGSGDKPPLMEHRGYLTDEVKLDFFGFGDKSSLREIIFSDSYDLVTLGAAKGMVNSDNELVFKDMVAATYDAAHSVPLDTTAGASISLKLYNTIKAAQKKALKLTNPLTMQKINSGSREWVLYVNSSDAIDLIPIIEGDVLDNNNAVTRHRSLGIDKVVEYDGAEENGVKYMGGTINYAGVPEGTAFLLLKKSDGAQKVKVIDWTMDAVSGNARIEGDEKYWWNYGGEYNENILPSVVDGINCGSIIKLTLTP